MSPPLPLDRADGARFAELVKAHESAIYGYALKLSGDRHEAHDLVQDTLERALRSFDRFTPGTNARAWLCTILYNLFIDGARRRKAEATQPIEELQVAADEPAVQPVWTNLGADELRAAIGALEDEFRAVCELRVIERLPYAEIATRLGLPRNTVATRLSRGRDKLRALLEARLGDER